MSDKGTVTSWNVRTGKPNHVSKDVTPPLLEAALSPDGRYLAYAPVGGKPRDDTDNKRRIVLHDLASKNADRTCLVDDMPSHLAVGETARSVFISSDHGIQLWRPFEESSPEPLATRGGPIALSRDGRYAVVALERFLELWNVEAGTHVASFTADATISSCALSDSGGIVAAGDRLGRVHILIASRGRER